MRRPLRVGAMLVVLAALCAPGAAATQAVARGPVTVVARFDPGATLGSSSALDVTLQLDPRRLTSAPLTGVRLVYPRGLGLITSGLGLAACTRPAEDFAKVLIAAPSLGGCSPNAVMGLGDALALVRLTNGQVIREYASVTLLAGPIERGRLGLVVYVDGQHPFGGKLAFAGDVRGAPAPYGGALAVRMPEIPGIEDLATISLVRLRIVIGSRRIRYFERRHGRKVAYHPGGVLLPDACPAGGFRFGVQVGFADGESRSGSTATGCPPAASAVTRH